MGGAPRAAPSFGGNTMFRLTEYNKDIIREYRRHKDHIERTIASVHGVLTKDDTDQLDKLETQLINRGLSCAMTAEDVQNYHYNKEVIQ
jgi:hypothetical protein